MLGSGIAGAATTTTTAVKDRATAIKDALSGLVKDGTITQAQADKVVTTLDSTLPPGGPGGLGGPGGGGRGLGPGVGPKEVASVLGITEDALRTARESGKTLAQIAQGKGISKADLISKLVAAAKTRLAADVTAGRLTQAQSDSITSGLTARVTAEVDQVGGPRGIGGRGGRGGHGPGAWKGGPGTTTPSPTTPPAPASPAPTTTPQAS